MERIYEDVDITGDVEGIAISGNRLSYTGFDCVTLPEDLMRYTELAVVLDLSHNKLKKIDELAQFIHLQDLNLDNNEIEDETEFPEMESLETLSLNKNKITDCEKLVRQLREKCKNLTYLSLLGNLACPHPLLGNTEEEYEEVRRYIASNLPNLEIIDWREVTDEERGQRATEIDITSFAEITVDASTYPASSSSNPRAAAGKVKYTYVGKQSEGNRFIRNNQL